MLRGAGKASLIFGIGFVAFSGVLSVVVLANSAHAANSASMDASVNINPSLTLTIPSNTITMNLDPATHAFDEKDLSVSVGTNNLTGYQLRVTTVGDATTLVNTADSTKTIPNLSSSSSAADFPANYWGYRLSNGSTSSGNYGQFTSPTLVSESDGPVNDITKTLGFAAKVDYTKPSGLYELNLNFTAVANPVPIYMQDLDPTVCTTTPTTVLDSRDNQEYIIQELADGNCWMMTNLNLGDIDNYPLQVANLDSSNTNIVTPVAAATFNSWKKSSSTGTYTAAELIPVSGTDSTSQTPYGTLYNYCAASGGDSRACVSSMSSQLSPSYDICPKGWRLPTGGSSGEFQTLYNNSAYNTNAKMRAPYTSGGAAFALAGIFYASTPTDQGSYGFYWSSTQYDNTSMYDLLLYMSNVYPAYYNSRNYGSSIRCVLK